MLSFNVSAQFTTENSPQLGDSNVMYIVDSTAVNLEETNGEGVVWDYQGLSHYGETRTIDVVETSEATYGASFPLSEKVIRTEGLLDAYVKEGDDERISYGLSYHDVDGDLVLILETVPGVYYTYPFEYGDAIESNVQGSATVPSLGATVPAGGTLEAKVDGKGTLILGEGTEYTDVLRYKMTSLITFNLGQLGHYQVETVQYEYYDHTVSNLPIFVHAYLWMGPLNGTPKREFTYVLSRDVAGFTANNAPQIGDLVELYVVDSSAVDYDAVVGDGAVWNYTGLTDYDEVTKTIDVVAVEDTDHDDIFTSADKVIRTEGLLDVYIEETSSERIGHGLVYHDEDGDLILDLDVNAASYYKYPMELGSENVEQVEGQAHVTFNGNTYSNIPVAGTYTSVVDGKGTIQLGSSSEVVEYEVYRYKLESELTVTFPGSLGEYTVLSKQYEYYEVNGSSLPVFVHTSMNFGPTNGTPKREYTLVLSKELSPEEIVVNELAPVIGDLVELYVLDSTVTDYASITGADVEWDYTDVEDYDETRTVEVISIEDADASEMFNKSDRVLVIESLMDAYIQEKTEERLGHGVVYHDEDGDFILNLSTDKAVVYEYPMTLGNVVESNISGTAEFEFNGNMYNVPASGVAKASIDGIGTLKLGSSEEADVYTNVQRYKLENTIKLQVTSNIEYTVLTTQYEYYDYEESNLPIFVHASLWMGPTDGAAKKEYSLVLSKNKIDPTIGINKEDLAKQVKVYPNPTNNVVNVELSFENSGVNVSLVDVSGRTVYSVDTNAAVETIDVSNLNNGVYFVKVTNNENSITKKVVVQ